MGTQGSPQWGRLGGNLHQPVPSQDSAGIWVWELPREPQGLTLPWLLGPRRVPLVPTGLAPMCWWKGRGVRPVVGTVLPWRHVPTALAGSTSCLQVHLCPLPPLT